MKDKTQKKLVKAIVDLIEEHRHGTWWHGRVPRLVREKLEQIVSEAVKKEGATDGDATKQKGMDEC